MSTSCLYIRRVLRCAGLYSCPRTVEGVLWPPPSSATPWITSLWRTKRTRWFSIIHTLRQQVSVTSLLLHGQGVPFFRDNYLQMRRKNNTFSLFASILLVYSRWKMLNHKASSTIHCKLSVSFIGKSRIKRRAAHFIHFKGTVKTSRSF